MSNTPSAALVLLNDPTYLEASRKLAERMMREAETKMNEVLARRTKMSPDSLARS